MTEEKRRFSRIVFEVAARLTVDDTTYNLDRITNLSVGGCLLSINEGFTVEQDCTVTILLDRMEPGVVVHGKIVRVAKGEVSIQFTAVTPENLQHLQNIIRYNADDPELIDEELSVRTGLQ
ncbi:PilZ domain-containing protein [Desulforhopalus sp. 52FAK]